MITIKVNELTGVALDWAVAKAEKKLGIVIEQKPGWPLRIRIQWPEEPEKSNLFSPTHNWSQGGPIIEREKITLIRCDDEYAKDAKGYTTNTRIPVWAAEHGGQHSAQSFYEGESYDPQYEISEADCMYGPTPLIAAMRCYVASKLGQEIDVPDELLKEAS